MKKRLVAVLISGIMAASMMTACGGSKSAATSTAASSVASEAEEATSEAESTVDDTEEADSEVEEADSTEEASSTATSSDISFVDGYYATDGNGHDFMIAFYENAPGDVAYVSDGTNEAFAEYTVENAKTSDGQDYLEITVGQTKLGYIADGTDGGAYIVDTDGNVYGAQALSEDEADQIYQAVKDANNAQVESDVEGATDVQYVDGYYANDGNGSDFLIAFFKTSAGDVAYVNDGENEVLAEYSTQDAQTDNGVAYTLVTVGNTQMGYYQAENGDIYIVDEDGTPYVAGQLSEDEAIQLFDIAENANQ